MHESVVPRSSATETPSARSQASGGSLRVLSGSLYGLRKRDVWLTYCHPLPVSRPRSLPHPALGANRSFRRANEPRTQGIAALFARDALGNHYRAKTGGAVHFDHPGWVNLSSRFLVPPRGGPVFGFPLFRRSSPASPASPRLSPAPPSYLIRAPQMHDHRLSIFPDLEATLWIPGPDALPARLAWSRMDEK
jgi:hypothetical protein